MDRVPASDAAPPRDSARGALLALGALGALAVVGLATPSTRPGAHPDVGSLVAGAADVERARRPGGQTTVSLVRPPSFVRPASNLDHEQKARFYAGKALATQPWVRAPTLTDARDGLGPL